MVNETATTYPMKVTIVCTKPDPDTLERAANGLHGLSIEPGTGFVIGRPLHADTDLVLTLATVLSDDLSGMRIRLAPAVVA